MAGPAALCLTLHPVGFARTLRFRRARVLLPPFFTLTPVSRGGLVSVALSMGCPMRVLPATAPCDARTFLRVAPVTIRLGPGNLSISKPRPTGHFSAT